RPQTSWPALGNNAPVSPAGDLAPRTILSSVPRTRWLPGGRVQRDAEPDGLRLPQVDQEPQWRRFPHPSQTHAGGASGGVIPAGGAWPGDGRSRMVPHRHETGPPGGKPTGERAVGFASESDEVARAESNLHISQDHAVVGELLRPRPRHPWHRACRNDPVVRAMFGESGGAVDSGERGPVADGGEAGPRGVDEVGVDVDRVHVLVAERV